jgi:hypothetical protein
MARRALVVLLAIFAIDVALAADPATPHACAIPAVQRTTRSTHDDAVGAAVAAALADDPRVRAMKIKVAVQDGVVTLTGAATTAEEKDTAEGIVRRVAGVRKVESRLELDPHGEPAPGASMIPEVPPAR